MIGSSFIEDMTNFLFKNNRLMYIYGHFYKVKRKKLFLPSLEPQQGLTPLLD